MKTLLLLRHAKSSWDDPSLADHERPLNERGKRDAPRVGRLVKDQGLVPDLIISSTAKRARKTAKKVAQHCGYAGEIEWAERLYHAYPDDYIRHIECVPDDHDRVMLVGHNPGLEELLLQLTGRPERMPTAALAHIEFDIAAWRDIAGMPTGTLVNLWRPKELPP